MFDLMNPKVRYNLLTHINNILTHINNLLTHINNILTHIKQPINPKGETPFELERIDPESGQVVSGKHFAWDAKTPLLRVDGPHAAPAQHYIDYNNVMIVGAGMFITYFSLYSV